MNRWLWTIAVLLTSIAGYGQNAHKNLLNGDMLYGYGKYADAEKEYRKADNESPGLKSSYNLGNTLMNQERYDEAIKKYKDALSKATKPGEKSAALHNLGNAYYKKKQFKESVDAYKQSLAMDPYDIQTKENLAIARRELRKQMQQQQQQDQQQQQQQDKNQNNNQDQADNNQNQNKHQQQQNQDSQNPSSDSKQKMTREDAQKLLDFIDDQDKKVGRKQRRQEQGKRSKGKDW